MMDLKSRFQVVDREGSQFLERLDSIVPHIDDPDLKRITEDFRSLFIHSRDEAKQNLPALLQEIDARVAAVEARNQTTRAGIETLKRELAERQAAPVVEPPAAPRINVAIPQPSRATFVAPTGAQLRKEILERVAADGASNTATTPDMELSSWVFDPSASSLSDCLSAPTPPESKVRIAKGQDVTWSDWLEQSSGAAVPRKDGPPDASKDREWGNLFGS